jgi:succinate dehydrogenase / fumarate reductase cytochrome b subunit
MADGPSEGGAEAQARAQAGSRPMPLSPHLTIYRWPITMAASIVHRATGLFMVLGILFITWWLIAAASGPDAYDRFVACAASPIGRLVLFGLVGSLAFHLLNGIRHLAWDLGYGYSLPTSRRSAAFVFGMSALIALGVFTLGYMQVGGLF